MLFFAASVCVGAEEPYSDVPVVDIRKPDVLVVESSIGGRALPVPIKAAFLAFLEPERFKASARQPDGSEKIQEFADAKHPDREVAYAGMQMLLGALKKHTDGRAHVTLTMLPIFDHAAEIRGLIGVSADDAGPSAHDAVSVQEALLSFGFACYDCRQGEAASPWHARFEAAQEAAKLQMRGCWKSDLEAMADLARRCASGTPGR